MSAVAHTAPLAIDDGRVQWTAAQFDAAVAACGERLMSLGIQGRLASLIDNSAAWAVLDRACARTGLVHVPLPVFFTPEQVGHALVASGVGTLVGWVGAGGPALT